MKKIIIGSALLIALATGFAYAHGNKWGGYHMMGSDHYGMMGGGFMDPHMMGNGDFDYCLGPGWYGNSNIDSEEYRRFFDNTSELRKKMHDLRFDYMEAYRNPKTDRETLLKLEQEMNELRKQMYEAHKQFRSTK